MKNSIKTIIMWLIIGIASIILLSAIVENAETKMSYDELINAINNSKVEKIQLEADGNRAYVKIKNDKVEKEVNIPSIDNFMTEINDDIAAQRFTFEEKSESIWIKVLGLLSPFAIIIALFVFWFLISSSAQGGGNKTMTFGKSRARVLNANDRAETVILNILRGSGISGLKGIEAMRDNKYIRPLILTNREKIEKYCEENNLNPRIDESNLESIYSRNKVRNIVIPYIKKEFNQNIIQTINRLSDVATDENEYLQKLTKEQYNEISSIEDGIIVLNLKKFNQLELVIKRRLILYTINEAIHTTNCIEKVNIDDIIKLCQNNIGNKYLSPIKLIKIYVKKGKIYFIKNLENN